MGFVNESMHMYVRLHFHVNVILAYVRVHFSTNSFLAQQEMEHIDLSPKQTFFKAK